jgi:hypothetical protein
VPLVQVLQPHGARRCLGLRDVLTAQCYSLSKMVWRRSYHSQMQLRTITI